MDWSPYKTVSDKLSLHERRRETRHLDELNESPFSYSQYSFLDANPSMLYPTQGQTEEARNAKHISQYSAQGGIAATTQFMGYNTNTPMLGKPTPLSSQDAHTMHNTPQYQKPEISSLFWTSQGRSRFNANGMVVGPPNRLVGCMSFGDTLRHSISFLVLTSATEKGAVDPLIERIIWESMLFEFMGKEKFEYRRWYLGMAEVG
ncbi:hypothetical protein N7463_005339 [Penicillium fimorum]|uniref:Uncharacterized protein n=1 Tax=Penicillium fimorum TaxID=1882269 RepID=A0A9W9XSA6_9EURO|nr:hypothetical protein N7463_005339 [Penicillium fimorum]